MGDFYYFDKTTHVMFSHKIKYQWWTSKKQIESSNEKGKIAQRAIGSGYLGFSVDFVLIALVTEYCVGHISHSWIKFRIK